MVSLHKSYRNKRLTFAFCFPPPSSSICIYPSPSAAVVHHLFCLAAFHGMSTPHFVRPAGGRLGVSHSSL